MKAKRLNADLWGTLRADDSPRHKPGRRHRVLGQRRGLSSPLSDFTPRIHVEPAKLATRTTH